MSVSVRPVWSTERSPGQPDYIKKLCLKKNTKLFILLLLLCLFYMYRCLNVCVCTMCMPGAFRGPNKEAEAGRSLHVWGQPGLQKEVQYSQSTQCNPVLKKTRQIIFKSLLCVHVPQCRRGVRGQACGVRFFPSTSTRVPGLELRHQSCTSNILSLSHLASQLQVFN